MPGMLLSVLHTLTHLIFQNTYDMKVDITTIIQLRKLW